MKNLSFAAAVTAVFLGGVVQADEYRTIDGTENNLANPERGAEETQLIRLSASAYEDGLSTPRGGDPTSLPSARAVSNAVSAQTGSVVNRANASDWLWQWGQFIDHDLDLTSGGDENFSIAVPQGDSIFDPSSTGTATIALSRSTYDLTTGTTNPREHLNEITSYIDASNVYGSTEARADVLRAVNIDGSASGRLATSTGDLLPLNTFGVGNDNGPAGGSDSDFFAAGDVRANEQFGLTATHTLFVREHNRLVGDLQARLNAGDATLIGRRDAAIAQGDNGVNNQDDFLYESARKVVGGYMQKVTYEEFLPTLLGGSGLSSSAQYDPNADATVATEFSTAAYRFGHTMLSSDLQMINPDGTSAGSVALQDAFFSPSLATTNGVDGILGGLATQAAQEVDVLIIEDVRDLLFGAPGSGTGFDLAALNVQRGRDHGLGSLNDVREDIGLDAYDSFLELAGNDQDLVDMLSSVYSDVDDVDLWIGGLAEEQIGDGLLGETFSAIVMNQFERSRDGDRFFYEFDLDHLLMLDPNFEATLLSDIIFRNTDLQFSAIGANVFVVPAAVPEPSALLLLSVGGLVMLRRRRN